MEARIARAAILVAALLSMGASYRTPNFVVTTSTPEFAKEVGDKAEEFRRELAVLWIGQELPRWSQPCPITVQTGPSLGAGGATSFVFDRGEVFGWSMNIQGTPERVIDSVLPHEVTHTIFASYFRRPLPRWADEGACTTVEHEVERRKQQQMLIQFLKTGRGIPFSKMFMMREYPPDVMPLYSQGYSLCRYLIQQGGRKKFVDFVADGMRNEQWTQVTKKYYGYANLGELQNAWVEWVRQGSPLRDLPEQDGTLLAANEPQDRPAPNLIYRGQSADPPAPPQPLSPAAPAPVQLASAAITSPPATPSAAPAQALPEPLANTPSQRQSATLSYPRDHELARAAVPTPPPATTAPPQHAPQSSTTPEPSRQVLLEWSRDHVDDQGRPLPPPPRPSATAPSNTPSATPIVNPFELPGVGQ